MSWCPRPELNWDHTFRKRVLYPFELRGLQGGGIQEEAGGKVKGDGAAW